MGPLAAGSGRMRGGDGLALSHTVWSRQYDETKVKFLWGVVQILK